MTGFPMPPRGREPHTDGGESLLVSYHGTILCADPASGALAARTLGDAARWDDLRVPSRDGAGDPGASFAFAEAEGASGGARPRAFALVPHRRSSTGRRFVTLLSDGVYITACDDLRVRTDERVARDWEIFLLIERSEVDFLAILLAERRLRLRGSDRWVDARRCGLTRGYTLRLADQAIRLPDTVDLRSELRELVHIDPVLTGGLLSPHYPSRGAPRAREKGEPRVLVSPLGNTANRALQYLVAENIRSRVDGATLHGVDLPEWPHVEAGAASDVDLSEGRTLHLGWRNYDFDLPGVADCLDRGVIDAVHLRTYPFNLALYPPLARCRALLPHFASCGEAHGFGPGELVCNVRGGEVLRGAHRDYLVLPPAYYEALRERSGLDLVFYGQLGDDPYSQALRARFPDARFVVGRDARHDFEVVRRSRNVAVGVSTFSWLAAWLGEAEAIYLPVAGLFSPVQHPNQSYLPFDDARYRFTLFPYAKMVDLFEQPREFERLQGLLADAMKPVSAVDVERICLRARGFSLPVAPLKGFDADHYLSCHADVADAFYSGRISSPLQHYVDHGFEAGLSPKRFDEAAYLRLHPGAALDIANGLCASPLHHSMS